MLLIPTLLLFIAIKWPLRELAEKTGIRDVALTQSSHVTSRAYFWHGEPALREDQYFVARVKDVQVAGLTELPLAERSTHPESQSINRARLPAAA